MMDFDKAIKLKDEEREKEILARLNDYDDKDLLFICREACSYDGSFDFVDAFDMEDVGDYIDTSDAYGFMCRIVYGNVNMADGMLRHDAYGNLESVNEWDLEEEARDNINDIAYWLMDNWHNVDCLYSDDEELFDAWDNIDRYGDDYYDDDEEK